jgi:hypothetical protein
MLITKLPPSTRVDTRIDGEGQPPGQLRRASLAALRWGHERRARPSFRALMISKNSDKPSYDYRIVPSRHLIVKLFFVY